MLAGRNGARGRIRTRTADALDIVSLLFGLRERRWSLQPVLPRHGFFTKEIGGLPHGGNMWAELPFLANEPP